MKNISNIKRKASLGRPPKKLYDSSVLMQELIDAAIAIYRETGELKATALELGLPPNKVKKLLITGGALTYPETERIQKLRLQGKSMEEIQALLNLSYSAIHTYLPYSKVIYKMSEISQNAERIRIYKDRKAAVEELKACVSEENLWRCVLVFEHYPFHTASGLPFTYSLKMGRNGAYTKELFIDRREHSKSLSWSSVKMAFNRVMEEPGRRYARPKDIADVRGISYSYSLLWRFGMITVPEEVEKKLRGQ